MLYIMFCVHSSYRNRHPSTIDFDGMMYIIMVTIEGLYLSLTLSIVMEMWMNVMNLWLISCGSCWLVQKNSPLLQKMASQDHHLPEDGLLTKSFLLLNEWLFASWTVGVDPYWFFRAFIKPITDIWNQYALTVKMKILAMPHLA